MAGGTTSEKYSISYGNSRDSRLHRWRVKPGQFVGRHSGELAGAFLKLRNLVDEVGCMLCASTSSTKFTVAVRWRPPDTPLTNGVRTEVERSHKEVMRDRVPLRRATPVEHTYRVRRLRQINHNSRSSDDPRASHSAVFILASSASSSRFIALGPVYFATVIFSRKDLMEEGEIHDHGTFYQ